MNFRTYAIICCTAAVLISGCKKKETEKSSLSGAVNFENLPTYVKKGDSFHISASGAYRPSDNSPLVGYRWYNPIEAKYDTLRLENQDIPVEFDFVVSKDTLGSFTLSVSAFADDYYSISKSSSFTVVNPGLGEGGSLGGHPFGSTLTGNFSDPRDGKTYYTTDVGGLVWTAMNLSYSADGSLGIPYKDSEAMSDIFGRYYTYDEALVACPEGWHLPSDADFVALAGSGKPKEKILSAAGALKGDVSFNGDKLWPYYSSSVIIDNGSGFTALPLGYLLVQRGKSEFIDYGVKAVFWTSDALDSERSIVRYMSYDSNDLFAEGLDRSLRASVRCVKD